MGQGSEPQLRFTSCFRCYPFEFCFHGRFIFSLHRRPDLPLGGAHVAFEQFIFCWPLPHVAGSPGRRVLPASLTSARPSDLPHLTGLSSPTGFRLNLTDLPCSHETLRLHASGSTRKPPGHSPNARNRYRGYASDHDSLGVPRFSCDRRHAVSTVITLIAVLASSWGLVRAMAEDRSRVRDDVTDHLCQTPDFGLAKGDAWPDAPCRH